MFVIVNEGGKEICYVKGVLERMIDKCEFILENNKIKFFIY